MYKHGFAGPEKGRLREHSEIMPPAPDDMGMETKERRGDGVTTVTRWRA